MFLLGAEKYVVEQEQPPLLLGFPHKGEDIPLIHESAMRLSERRIVLERRKKWRTISQVALDEGVYAERLGGGGTRTSPISWLCMEMTLSMFLRWLASLSA